MTVEVFKKSSCLGCKLCSGHIIKLPIDSRFKIGDEIELEVSAKQIMLSVLFAFIIPSILLVGTVFLLSVLGVNELVIVTILVAILFFYFFLFFIFRDHMNKSFKICVNKNDL